MVTVRAKEKMYYAGRDRLSGEEYDMDDREHSEINVLCLLGKIERVADAEKPVQAETAAQPAALYQTAAVQPEGDQSQKDSEEETQAEEEGTTRRRQYRRRDMRPER